MKYEILAYSHCGCDYYKFYAEAESEEEAEKIFEAASYPSDHVERVYEYEPEEPVFITLEQAVIIGAEWEEMRNKRKQKK